VLLGGGQIGAGGGVADRGDLRPFLPEPSPSAQLDGRSHRVGDGSLLVVEGEEGLGGRVARGEDALVGEFASTV
jgi:hypothetical protein